MTELEINNGVLVDGPGRRDVTSIVLYDDMCVVSRFSGQTEPLGFAAGPDGYYAIVADYINRLEQDAIKILAVTESQWPGMRITNIWC